MFDEDKEDTEWEEEASRAHAAVSEQKGGSSKHRVVRPLPKRQKSTESLSDLPATPLSPKIKEPGGRATLNPRRNQEDTRDEELEVDIDLARRNEAASILEPTHEYRELDERIVPRSGSNMIHNRVPTDLEQDESSRTSLEPSEPSTSPPTSPCTDCAYSLTTKDRGPNYFTMFGKVGEELLQRVKNAPLLPASGLFGGLEMHGLRSPDDSSMREETLDDGCYDEEDDDCFFTPTQSGVGCHTNPVGGDFHGHGPGSNKKKRKVPGMIHSNYGAERECGDDMEERAETYTSETIRMAKERNKVFESTLPARLRAPLNPPKTAKDALAILRCRPPRVSIDHHALSRRRYRREYFKRNLSFQHPLDLPPMVTSAFHFVHSRGPPPLLPGSGLKGSKALKAAMKAEKEREKEKERMKLLLGGDKILLPNLYDPLGRLATAKLTNKDRINNSRVDHHRTRTIAGGINLPLEGKIGALSLNDNTSFPSFQSFDFMKGMPEIINLRWKALHLQIERINAIKEKSILIREEEKLKSRERELEREAAVLAEVEKKSRATANKESSTYAPRSVDTNPNLTPTHPLVNDASNLARKGPLRKGKKKRSAHANANNVHHRDNYIPSRSPVFSPASHGYGYEDGNSVPHLTSWPPSEEALAAGGGRHLDISSYLAGSDEWLCAFCDYELFYGDRSSFSKAVQKRRGVLKVRRKAQDRAAKATKFGADSVDGPPQESVGQE